MEKSYVIKLEDGGYRLTGSRVSLDSIVYDWWNGLSPESIVENFQTLTLEQVYGAIAYYLAHKEEVDAQIQRNREKFEELREQWRAAHPRLYEKLKAAVEAETSAVDNGRSRRVGECALLSSTLT